MSSDCYKERSPCKFTSWPPGCLLCDTFVKHFSLCLHRYIIVKCTSCTRSNTVSQFNLCSTTDLSFCMCRQHKNQTVLFSVTFIPISTVSVVVDIANNYVDVAKKVNICLFNLFTFFQLGECVFKVVYKRAV